MGRILALDYGRKRTGVAVTDPLQIIANGLTTVPTAGLMDYVKEYTSHEDVELIVIGLPKQMNNEPSESMKYITPFVNLLRKQLPGIKIEMYDERFTSVIAHQTMIDGGMKKSDRRNKETVDCIAASIILNDYLTSKKQGQRL
jgi:putative Holliday junction resolvase